MQHDTGAMAPELREYVATLRRRKWIIVIIAGLTLASALVVSFRQTPIYESTARVEVKPPTANQLLQGISTANVVSMDTEKELVTSQAVAGHVEDELGTGLDPEKLAEPLDVTVPANTQILEITYADARPIVAQQRAQAFADAYLKFKTDQSIDASTRVKGAVQDAIDRAQEDLTIAREKLVAAEPGSPDQQEAQTDIDALTGQIAILRSQIASLSVLDISPGTVIDPAGLPLEPARPNHLLNGGLALMIGLGLGVGFAFLRERLDDRLSGREEFEQTVGAPVLAVVPRVPKWDKRDRPQLVARAAPKSPPAESYRTLRTNLQFIARDGGFKILSVTSPSLGEGKTTTTANLAVTMALSGKRVIAVSCDLRKPRLHRFFEATNDYGVTSILTGQRHLVDAVQRCGIDNLRFLSSGPIAPNPAELLGSEDMEQLLRDLRRFADFTVIDTPPVLAVSDALELATRSDGVLVVGDAATTTRGAVQHVREQLEQVGANIVGGVLNNLDPNRAKYYPSYYRYYYAYRYPSEQEEPTLIDARKTRVPDPEEMWR